MLTYQSENSVSPTGSYVSDDYFGFLEDQYGEGIGDKLAIGVGRIACETETEANAMVDKIVAYMRHPSAEVMEGAAWEQRTPMTVGGGTAFALFPMTWMGMEAQPKLSTWSIRMSTPPSLRKNIRSTM